MKFIADVNVAQLIIKQLRQNGHSAVDVKKEEFPINDVDIIKLALRDNYIVLTHDKDADASYFYERVADVLNSKTERELLKALTIITESGFELYPYPLGS